MALLSQRGKEMYRDEYNFIYTLNGKNKDGSKLYWLAGYVNLMTLDKQANGRRTAVERPSNRSPIEVFTTFQGIFVRQRMLTYAIFYSVSVLYVLSRSK